MGEGVEFEPAWASAPGATIADVLRERAIDVGSFREKIGLSAARMNCLLRGELRIDEALAQTLAGVLGGSAMFWTRRDAQYCADLTRLSAVQSDTSTQEWLRSLPTSDMRKWGWLEGVTPSSGSLAQACFAFFGVEGLADWRSHYNGISQLVAFRRSDFSDASPHSVAAWLRQGEIEADKINCSPFDRDRLIALLPEIRSLTRIGEPSDFIPKLVRACATGGVAIAVVRAPAKCGISGAARFMDTGKALVQLSFRYRSDDHFWFTVFHELAHLILHGPEAFFLEGKDLMDTEEEREANRFAGDFLIPVEHVPTLPTLGADFRKVMRFAKRIGVSPGIVVGRLQHEGLIPRSYLNKLKVKYVWSD